MSSFEESRPYGSVMRSKTIQLTLPILLIQLMVGFSSVSGEIASLPDTRLKILTSANDLHSALVKFYDDKCNTSALSKMNKNKQKSSDVVVGHVIL